jgi:GAF domain-containing protein
MPPTATPLPLPLPESPFTEVAALTALLFGVPLVLLVLVEENELDYHATYGLWDTSILPAVGALCLLTVQQQAPLVLPDLTQLPEFRAEASEETSPPTLRFYAGVPLTLPGLPCWGTLCVLDQQPRAFGAPHQQVLTQLARVIVHFFTIRQHCLTSWPEAATYWRIVQQELLQEVRTLLALVRLRTEVGGELPGPVPDALLEVVDQQLSALSWRLADYLPNFL